MPPQIVIVGGGVAGLAATYELSERSGRLPAGTTIVCLEAADRPGGNIRTDALDGFTCEWGPNGFLNNVPATLDLVRRLGIEDRLLPADEASAIRFIYRDGRLRRLPAGAASFLTSDILTWKGKLAVLGEPFRPPRRDGADESVFDFAARRIGPEAARVLVDAMVSGIYAGDARTLSLRATFPKMERMEREHGGLVRAMLARMRRRSTDSTPRGGPAGPAGHLTSFRGGLEDLIRALARAAGSKLRLRSGAALVTRAPTGGYDVRLRSSETLHADAVVLACPAWFAAELTGPLDPSLSVALGEIPSAPLAVVHLGYDEPDTGGRPDGFGFLVPRGEGPRILGALWASSIFPGRAPQGRVLLTCMIGGAHDQGVLAGSDDDLVGVARTDLRTTMGITAPPRFVRVYRHPRGIPQYTIGHPARLERIGERLAAFPGLLVSGNSYHGISVNACVDEAPAIAESVVSFLSPRT